MNLVVLMGRLTKDPEIRQTQGENPMVVAHYRLAVDRRFTRNGSSDQTADFLNIVSFGKQAEFIERYVHKGTKLVVRGRIQTGSYTNKDGQKVYTTDIVADDVEFAESKKASEGYDGASSYGGSSYGNSSYGASSNGGQSYGSSSGSSYGGNEDDGFMNVPEGINEELPFE